MTGVVVLGGYGIFGGQVACGLARLGMTVTIAGRDGRRAQAMARELGASHRGLAGDLRQPDFCVAALKGQTVAVHCAGPFAGSDRTVLEACLRTGCHYVDIADDRGYARLVRSYDERFRSHGLAAVYGCSSFPGISGALALAAAKSDPGNRPAAWARATLFIGNKNPKGLAAIRSALSVIGRPIQAPQGTLDGFRDPEVVALPKPFGPRVVLNFESPEYDLFPDLLRVRSVRVKVGFELPPVTATFALLARFGLRCSDGTARLLEYLGRWGQGWGSSGAVIRTDLGFTDGSIRHATLLAHDQGQYMAGLPAILATRALCTNSVAARGALTAYELLGADFLLEQLVAQGFKLHLGRNVVRMRNELRFSEASRISTRLPCR
jgi:hypothetical protein